ncbi:hypothetical protein [Nocardiopsis trehalosi]|jgi:hypothetical protein|uniref:hypothetical protein n=1 Tax=Nocardiopsis trehalosi TaxID=109329 RepID=UPI000836A2F9|nr:hypothetical protein [Nocardiopsis trehalosi]
MDTFQTFATATAAIAAVTFGPAGIDKLDKIKGFMGNLGRQLNYLVMEHARDRREAGDRALRTEQQMQDAQLTANAIKRAVGGVQRTSDETARRLDRIERTHSVAEAMRATRTPARGAGKHTVRALHRRTAREGARPKRDGRPA